MDYMEMLDKNYDAMVDALAGSIRMKSVLAPEEKGPNGEVYHFGKDIHEAYMYVMKLGEEMGFDTANFDNYGGHIEWKAEDPNAEVFAIVGHVDVVPEGEGWEDAPYDPVIKDGWMNGRGTTDDKGPVISCLYAMKVLKDAGAKPKKTIRLIIGLDEETEKRGMVYYLEKAGMPDLGITPDGEFPLINGEMGILVFQLASKLEKKHGAEGHVLRKMESGIAYNVVPNSAKAVIAPSSEDEGQAIIEKAKKYAEESGHELSAKKAGKSIAVETKGVQAHGARPELGLNAISVMMGFLGTIEFSSDSVNDFISYYNEHIGFDLSGERIGCAFEDEPSGKLIFNVGLASIDEEIASVTINIRFPVTNTGDEVYAGIEKTLEGTKIGIVKEAIENPIFIDPEDDFVKKLMEAYVEETGDTEGKPFVIGGGTYAKLMHRVLAFGAMFPGEEDRMHQPNEKIDLESYKKMTRVYAKMLEKICF